MRAVHVAGWGAVSGFGVGREALLEGVWSGASALVDRRRTAGGPVPTSCAAEVPGLERLPPAARARTLGRWAAEEALLQAGGLSPDEVPLVLASTKGELTGLGGESDCEGFGAPGRLAQGLAAELRSPALLGTVSCACASGLLALGLAARRIARGEVDRALVVGVDVLEPFVLAGFGVLSALDPGPCRPFDRARRGTSLGDGAAAVVLSAHARESLGARLLGRGGANDACHVTGPDRSGLGVALAAERALAQAGLRAAQLDLLHLHGTGTAANDRTEALGLVHLFGGRTAPAFGTKAQTGHTLGAAGVLETCLLIEALRRGVAPPNLRLEEPDVHEDLHLLRAEHPLPPRSTPRRGLKVASGFGGIVAALVVEA
jgi:3-oxoacyl-[acyl-carrier-protein] synthase-1